MPQKGGHRQTIPILSQIAAEMGYELFDVELVKEGPGRYLRIYLDKEGGISLDDCEAYHRRIQPELESIDYDFLEVSSPGLDRPLKEDRDFERALQSEVEIKLFKPQMGQKTLTGILLGWDSQCIRVGCQDGERQIQRGAVAMIRPVIHFDDEGEEQ